MSGIAPSLAHPGSCLCGGVRFVASGPLRPVLACHCRQCRKQSGHYFAMTSVSLDRFLLIAGDDLAWYRASEAARRGFCGVCGSTLFWQPDAEPRISIAGGAFDGPLGVTIGTHIFCADKGDYYRIDDGPAQDLGWSG